MIIKTKFCYINIIGIRFEITCSLTGINIGCKHYRDLNDFKSRYISEGKENNYSDIELKWLLITLTNNLKLIKELK